MGRLQSSLHLLLCCEGYPARMGNAISRTLSEEVGGCALQVVSVAANAAVDAATQVIHAPVASLVAVGAGGYLYGKTLATVDDPACDPIGLQPRLETISKCVDSLEDRGYLQRYHACGVECLGVAGLPFEKVDVGGPMVPPVGTCDFAPRPILYESTKIGSKVHIAKEHVPAFLLDNGVALMEAEELGEHLKSRMSTSFPISECKCVGKFDIRCKPVVASLDSSSMQGLGPGDARYRIHIDQPFASYTSDRVGYEERLKDAIMEALGLDSGKIPGVKKHIKIETVRAGSVIVEVVIGLVVVALAAVALGFCTWAGYHAYRKFQTWRCKFPRKQGSSTGPTMSTPPNANTEERAATHVSVRSLGDEDWEAVLHLHHATKCYLPDTLFRTPEGRFVQASHLQVNDVLRGIDGQDIRVMNKEVAKH